MIDLPPLPEPDGWRITDGEGGYFYSDESPDEFNRAWAGRYQRQHHAMFTTDALHAYARAAVAAEREACAALCEQFRASTLTAQSGPEHELSNVMLRQVAELGHGECAAAIRARATMETHAPST